MSACATEYRPYGPTVNGGGRAYGQWRRDEFEGVGGQYSKNTTI